MPPEHLLQTIRHMYKPGGLVRILNSVIEIQLPGLQVWVKFIRAGNFYLLPGRLIDQSTKNNRPAD